MTAKRCERELRRIFQRFYLEASQHRYIVASLLVQQTVTLHATYTRDTPVYTVYQVDSGHGNPVRVRSHANYGHNMAMWDVGA